MAAFRSIILTIVGIGLLATTTTNAAAIKPELKAGLKKLLKDSTRCPKVCNSFYSDCEKVSNNEFEEGICLRAIIICQFGCTKPEDTLKRKLLRKMTALVLKNKSSQG
uniref:Uncharacterized protein n=1 Tax=Clytia hemisphaerica TaxID=252671 RepID=A0A7M5ULI4_9CNID